MAANVDRFGCKCCEPWERPEVEFEFSGRVLNSYYAYSWDAWSIVAPPISSDGLSVCDLKLGRWWAIEEKYAHTRSDPVPTSGSSAWALEVKGTATLSRERTQPWREPNDAAAAEVVTSAGVVTVTDTRYVEESPGNYVADRRETDTYTPNGEVAWDLHRVHEADYGEGWETTLDEEYEDVTVFTSMGSYVGLTSESANGAEMEFQYGTRKVTLSDRLTATSVTASAAEWFAGRPVDDEDFETGDEWAVREIGFRENGDCAEYVGGSPDDPNPNAVSSASELRSYVRPVVPGTWPGSYMAVKWDALHLDENEDPVGILESFEVEWEGTGDFDWSTAAMVVPDTGNGEVVPANVFVKGFNSDRWWPDDDFPTYEEP